ncbi:MAG TPA: hypothetical protein VNV66_15510 [Pilimelia sp.]|nr:hypothetical protein [Pilimelia sp.]
MVVSPTRPMPNLIASLAVLVAAALLAFGLPALDRALPAERPVEADQRYEVGAGVSVLPPAGALLDVTRTRPREDRGTALFVLGGVRYAIVVEPFDGTLPAAAERLRQKITAGRGYQVAGVERPAVTATGLAGIRGGYTAPRRAGRYSVFLVDGLVIEVTVSGADAALRGVLDRIDASTRSLAVRSPR